MDRPTYLREIEALVQHLHPLAQLLSDMDLHVAERLYDDGIPLETTLAGIRKGAARLARLKRPPRGLPLKRIRGDVVKELRRGRGGRVRGTDAAAAGADSPTPPPPDDAAIAEAGAEPDARWRRTMGTIAAELDGASADALRALADEPGLGEERAFVRYLDLSQDHYQRLLEALPASRREALEGEVGDAAADVLRKMSAEARAALVDELVRRRLMAQDPVLDPGRFWQD